SRRAAPEPQSPLRPWRMPPPLGWRPFGASPARARPLAAPRPVAPAGPRPAHPARPAAGRDARPAAPASNRGPTRPARPTARRQRCLWPPEASRESTGTHTPRALPRAWHPGSGEGRGAHTCERPALGRAARSPGGLVRIGLLLLHRLVGLAADPDAGVWNGDHEAVAHPQRPRLVGGERVAPRAR